MTEFLTSHWLDIVTTVLGLAYILLEYRASIWMWAVGFAMQALGIVLYYQKGLYADCGMEFYYLTMTVYGYWKWKTHPQPLSVEGGGIKSLLPSLNRERLGVGLLTIGFWSRSPILTCRWPTRSPRR